MGFAGLLIRRRRLEKGWSQQGLCKGICAVSYLSKIEQGKAEPGEEVLSLLLGRLGVTWHTGAEAEAAGALAERYFDAFCTMNLIWQGECREELEAHRETYVNSPYLLDLLLLEGVCQSRKPEGLEAFVGEMDARQRGLWYLLEERYQEAVPLLPFPVTYALAGCDAYTSGNYFQAMEQLGQAFRLASEQCQVFVMAFCRNIQGNCCSDLGMLDAALGYYRDQERLAQAFGDGEAIRVIRYNIAASQTQLGRYREGYAYFSTLDQPTAAELHKLAVCCEGLGRREEALAALDRVDGVLRGLPEQKHLEQMCAVVRCRLEHPDYLKREEYGALLIGCYRLLRDTPGLPRGYALFHLPWLEEWYAANRQYKQAWELMREFPQILASSGVKKGNDC